MEVWEEKQAAVLWLLDKEMNWKSYSSCDLHPVKADDKKLPSSI